VTVRELAQQAEALEVEHRSGIVNDNRQNFQSKRMVLGAEMRVMQHRTGALLVLASAAAFGVMPIFGKLAFEAGVGVATLLVIRFAIATPVLWGAVAVRRVFPREAGRGVLGRALALGAVGYAMQAGLYFLALERMDASVLSLILYSYPALVTGAAILLGREAANRRRLVALVIASGGLVLVLAGAGAGSLDLAGMALGAGAALTYTTYILVSDGVSSQLEALPLAALVSTGAAVSLGFVAAATGSLDLGFDASGWVWLGCAALVSTVAALVLFFSGMSRVGPSTAAILSTLEPPVTVALVFVTFGEALGAVQILGALAVLGAAVLVNLPSRAKVVTVS
jgi:drug/metabolite transporter (DMT)-like permease